MPVAGLPPPERGNGVGWPLTQMIEPTLPFRHTLPWERGEIDKLSNPWS